MENASKALIIAGAILLAILIISLGILIFGQAKGVIDGNAMSDVEIQQFNGKFTMYEGERVRGATVNSMLQTVLANNVSADDDNRKVKIEGNAGISMEISDTSIPANKAKTGAIYKVTCNYGTGNGNKGLVTSISVDNP